MQRVAAHHHRRTRARGPVRYVACGGTGRRGFLWLLQRAVPVEVLDNLDASAGAMRRVRATAEAEIIS